MRKPRRFIPDLEQIASATECTGILPAQPAEEMPPPEETAKKGDQGPTSAP
ncbi:MAG: hypothetical protein IJ189_12790 [Clostridia bacterium]|nr:hypothetical protein [Clostridia bacterium]